MSKSGERSQKTHKEGFAREKWIWKKPQIKEGILEISKQEEALQFNVEMAMAEERRVIQAGLECARRASVTRCCNVKVGEAVVVGGSLGSQCLASESSKLTS